jgi:hypothetical protein
MYRAPPHGRSQDTGLIILEDKDEQGHHIQESLSTQAQRINRTSQQERFGIDGTSGGQFNRLCRQCSND